jgi:hypothetical protein
MRHCVTRLTLLLVFLPGFAAAQSAPPFTSETPVTPGYYVSGLTIDQRLNQTGGSYPLGYFATTNEVQTAFGTASGQLTQLNWLTTKNFNALEQDVALASAFTIIPPNPGDRFSVTFGAAGIGSQGGGAISFSYRPFDQVLFFAAYARATSQQAVKAGVSFSFH